MALHPGFKAFLPIILDVLGGKGKVKAAYVFGSACTEHFSEKSDIDLLIELDDSDLDMYVEEWWRILFELEDKTGRAIDLLTPNSLGNPYFRDEVMETRERLL